MVKVFIEGHHYEYELKELLKLFYKQEDIEFLTNQPDITMLENTNDDIIINKLVLNRNIIKVISEGRIDGEKAKVEKQAFFDKNPFENTKKKKQLMKTSIFQLLKRSKVVSLPWGILTGIRPTKIVHELRGRGLDSIEIITILTEEYFIEKEKALLLVEVAATEHKYLYPINEDKISIYISIPFCPTRCSYCSFPSNPFKRYQDSIDTYIEALCKEIVASAELLNKTKKKIETIYIGGGTPTTLNLEQLSKLIKTIFINFNLSELKEFTVEAGRPDTIDIAKLVLLKKNGVTRISINPQTMNDQTLIEIGRNHTTAETIEAYKIAKDVGFYSINMDIIIGLPGENVDMVLNTMEHITKLAPNNLTVHTLAIKNASELKEQQYKNNNGSRDIHEMLKVTENHARKMGLIPYYMYRQKHMVGNLENIGYAKEGYECIYNIQIMEEKQTIVAIGAGAVSKIVFPKENRLERVPNVKNLEQYIARVDEMILRKKQHLQ
ncbi:coproporphyrinogen dehydrogenase HemZ [Natronincola peptidivorans]|nr:coproporphyrinogen dehydrogenase HemZ [Natronincola peptidivorans]